MLKVALQVPEPFMVSARYAFQELAMRWRLPVRFVETSANPDLCYMADSLPSPPGAVRLRFDPAMFAEGTVCRAVTSGDGYRLWCTDSEFQFEPDLVGAVFRLLTFLDETQVSERCRDGNGSFFAPFLPVGRRDSIDYALVEHAAASLLHRILRERPLLERARVARWPGKASWAIALTHDVDAVHVGAPLELITNGAKAISRFDCGRLRAVAEGLRFVGRMPDNPFFAFEIWRHLEAKWGIRSAFYVYRKPRNVRRAIHDCKSSLAAHPRGVWTILRTLVDDGWEIGLHPSIHTKDASGGFVRAKGWLESQLERPIAGVRHHYFALDWRYPITTHKAQMGAGFSYDSSIAYRDRAGFRAGTALPYRPFDGHKGTALDFIEIPPVLMDIHLTADQDRHRAVRHGQKVIGEVKRVGGLLTADWHQESGCNRLGFSGYVDLIEELLRPGFGSSDVWFATPSQVATHWKHLTGTLLGA